MIVLNRESIIEGLIEIRKEEDLENSIIVNNIKSIKILADKPELGNRYVISIMRIIEIIDEKFQNVDISNIGETDCIVEFKKSKGMALPMLLTAETTTQCTGIAGYYQTVSILQSPQEG